MFSPFWNNDSTQKRSLLSLVALEFAAYKAPPSKKESLDSFVEAHIPSLPSSPSVLVAYVRTALFKLNFKSVSLRRWEKLIKDCRPGCNFKILQLSFAAALSLIDVIPPRSSSVDRKKKNKKTSDQPHFHDPACSAVLRLVNIFKASKNEKLRPGSFFFVFLKTTWWWKLGHRR